ncbi:hypothetical protein E2C01_098241 [Portunus trituberculatus]|uniref:Uncharacterized protein n=1 Tax=Portunus trituberculatus TaxID=210409 RepID=A0A5B7KDQ0_PORTR|nr:hypothetical protein [Portunus trituberculatus]
MTRTSPKEKLVSSQYHDKCKETRKENLRRNDVAGQEGQKMVEAGRDVDAHSMVSGDLIAAAVTRDDMYKNAVLHVQP